MAIHCGYFVGDTTPPGCKKLMAKHKEMQDALSLIRAYGRQAWADEMPAKDALDCMMALQEALDEFETIGVFEDEEIPGWVILARQVLKENRAALTELGLDP